MDKDDGIFGLQPNDAGETRRRGLEKWEMFN
jgi:hypothetical protein